MNPPTPAPAAAELTVPDKIQIKSTRWYHDRIIDMMLASEVPMSQNEIAKAIGYSATWVSIMVNSDAFKNRLAARKVELTDPMLAASINERLDGLAKTSLDRLAKRLDISGDTIQTKDLIAIAKLAIGDKNTRTPPPAGPNLYVVNIPPVAQNSRNWLDNAQGRKEGSVATHGSPLATHGSARLAHDSARLLNSDFCEAAILPPGGDTPAPLSDPGVYSPPSGDKSDPLSTFIG